MQIKVLHDDGIPKDTLIVTVPHSNYWLEFKKWNNGRFCVFMCEPHRDRKRLIHQSISLHSAKKLMDFALLPHKRILSIEDFTKEAKHLVKPKNKFRYVKRNRS